MKKIIAGIILASAVVCGFAAKPRLKDHITEIRLGKYEPAELGTGTMRLEKTFGHELVAVEFSVMVYPKNGTAGLLYKNGGIGIKERILFDKDARDALRAAYEQYIDDYENKRLERQKKFVKAYGVARTKLEWGPFQYSTYVEPKTYFGYVFVGKSPYFGIRIPDTVSPQKKGDVDVHYVGNLLYFTRAQIKDLVEAMDEEGLFEAIESQKIVLPANDEYEEPEADGAGVKGVSAEPTEEYEEN